MGKTLKFVQIQFGRVWSRFSVNRFELNWIDLRKRIKKIFKKMQFREKFETKESSFLLFNLWILLIGPSVIFYSRIPEITTKMWLQGINSWSHRWNTSKKECTHICSHPFDGILPSHFRIALRWLAQQSTNKCKCII